MKGLTNVGNTCYLNAALQCLVYAPPLTNYALSPFAAQDLQKRRVNACGLASEYLSLVSSYWGSKEPSVIDTTGLWNALCKVHKPFANAQPHDAHEALLVLVHCLHDALSKAPRLEHAREADAAAWDAHLKSQGYSMITELFDGQMECVVHSDDYRNVTHEHFTGLSLDLDGVGSIGQALERSLRPERIEDVDIGDGKRAAATQTRRLTYVPPVLILHLKRFAADGTKMDRFIDYTTELDLQGCGTYDLFAVIMHRDGHYVAVCEVGGQWHLMDDVNVTRIEVNAVVQRDAYVLMYKKR